MSKIETTTRPTGTSSKPYIISSQEGEIIYIPLSKSATRLLVTGKETDDAFAVVGSGGSQGDPIGFHYHREAHDVFLCLKGQINVWADDQCRTLSSGDFASVPPGTIHQYQIVGPHSEMVGLIVPGGWEEFFRFIGEPYDGATWPLEDNRNFFEVLLPKLKAAAEKFDMVPCPQHRGVEPQSWAETDSKLPGSLKPYFLKNATGPAYLAGGTVCRPLATTAESGGKFSIGQIEISSHPKLQAGLFAASSRRLAFDLVHHAFLAIEGVIQFHLGTSEPADLHAGELIFVPKGTDFSIAAESRFASFYVFANGPSLTELYQRLGGAYRFSSLPDRAAAWDESGIDALSRTLSCRFS
ncbi:hypothetical protein B0A48_07615 [Cryoendolithus antarcticus]|uniref:Cupin type-2 domain-containing protein n=1 Tax=Cryoendolithus antarcticus TaxID=1507870 RepID=A0A1V8T6U5_9PEZI|nr:hypothetical protein B0A48_07615 [Cryoendolithus antarcticus]